MMVDLLRGVSNNARKTLAAGIVLWLLASSILIYFHFSATLIKPHYQYVILIPFLVAYLLWQRHTNGALKTGTPSVFWMFLWGLCFLGLAVASWIFSPWLAMAFLISLGPVTCLALGGWPLFKSTWGIWLVASFMLPIPFQFDERLIVELRNIATRVTSGVLDQFGVLHMVAGNVIELPEKKLFIADACSGIHSLFVLLAAAAVVAVWNMRGPIATILLLVGTFGLVMVENILRLLTVSGSIRLGYDLSSGMPHEILGLILFVVSLVLVLSLDQWIAFFTIQRSPKKQKDAKPTTARELPELPVKAFLCVGGFALLLLPFQFVRMPAVIPSLGEGFASPIEISELGEDFLPEQMSGFRRQGFEVVERVFDDPFGNHSQIWRYRNGRVEMSLSLNYAYRDIHDACVCYENTGWNITNEKIVGVTDDGTPGIVVAKGTAWDETPVMIADMANPLEGEGVLLYSMLSESGKIGVGIASRNLEAGREQMQGRFRKREVQLPEQWVQLQATVLSVGELTESEKSEILEVFNKAKAMIFARCVEDLGIDEKS